MVQYTLSILLITATPNKSELMYVEGGRVLFSPSVLCGTDEAADGWKLAPDQTSGKMRRKINIFGECKCLYCDAGTSLVT